MIENQELLSELQKINRRLDIVNNPFKNAFYNLIAGFFRAIGNLIGTLVIAYIVYFFLSQINLVKPASQFIESLLSDVNWQKIIPTPSIYSND